jgi:fibronectin-binding autotransporter adhesin
MTRHRPFFRAQNHRLKASSCFARWLISVGLGLSVVSAAFAASASWRRDANGSWSVDTNWTGIDPQALTDVATFGSINLTANRTVTLDANRSIASLVFNADTYGYTISGTNTLTLNNSVGITQNGSATNTISAPLTLATNQTWGGTGTGQIAITGVVSGNASITKNGSYTLVLSGANTYTGATTINSGTVRIQSNGALGTAANTANTTVASGAVLQMANGITTTNSGTLVLNGTGVGSGALQSVSGNNSWNSAISLGSDATIYSGTAGNTLYLNSDYLNGHALTLGNHTLTVDGPGDTWANANVGVAGDTGGLIKNGTGKLTLYGYNTFYTGATTVNAGSLDLIVGPFNTGVYGINGSLTIGTGPANSGLAGTVNVNIATNSYANQISPTSAVTINSDGALNVGASTGMGALTLNGGQVKLNAGIAISPTSVTANTNSAHQTSLISGGQVTLSGATNFTVARDATLTSDLTISSTISGGSIVKQGAGVLTLTSANTLTGTTINAGVINAQASNALGTTNGVTVANGAALQTQGGISLAHTTTTLNGSGVSNTGALRNVSGNNSLTGAVTLGSASRINSDAGTLTLTGGLTTAGNALTIGGAGNTTLSGTLSFGSTALTKVDAGTLTLNSNLDLSGGTLSLNGGTLALNGITLSVGAFNVGSNSVIDFGGAASVLNVNSVSIATGAILTIANWTNTIDYFYSLIDPGTTNLSQIVFTTFAANSTHWQSWDKQVTPVPEPSTYGLLLMGAGLSFYLWRRRHA